MNMSPVNKLFFQSGAGGHWLMYVLSCLKHGEFNMDTGTRNPDSYHADNHLISDLIEIPENHWNYNDLNLSLQSNLHPFILYEPTYYWNLYQNWLFKHELFCKYDEYFIDGNSIYATQFGSGLSAYTHISRWENLENRNISVVRFSDIYFNTEKFIKDTYKQAARTIPYYNYENDKLFEEKIKEFKQKSRPIDELMDTGFWYGFLFKYIQSQIDYSMHYRPPQEFYNFNDFIDYFKDTVLPNYEDNFINMHVLRT